MKTGLKVGCCPTCGGEMKSKHGVAVDASLLTVAAGGVRVKLRPMEFKLVELLVRRAPRALNREVLWHALYGDRPDCDMPDNKVLDVHLAHVRRKFEATGMPLEIVNIPWTGWSLVVVDRELEVA
jgi:DNA-binding response OmpR family regulator